MNENLTRLARRREELTQQAATQRTALSQDAESWRIVLERADQGLAALHYLKTHPIWLVSAGGILLTVLGPGRVWRWMGRGVFAWRIASRLRIR